MVMVMAHNQFVLHREHANCVAVGVYEWILSAHARFAIWTSQKDWGLGLKYGVICE